MKNTNTEKICYNGIGARKNRNHTQKQYLKIMDKLYKKKCAVYNKSLKCKSCKNAKDLINNEIKKSMKSETYFTSKNTEMKIDKYIKLCKKCKTTNTRKCDLKKYITFSGAEIGTCESLGIE